MSEQAEKTVRAAVAGDRSAFRQLVLEHSRATFRLAWRLSGDEGMAEDIVQEAFIKAWRNIGEFRMDASFRSWLHRITVNTGMDYLRKQSRRGRVEVGEQTHESIEGAEWPDHGRQIDIRRETEAAMLRLSDIERAALMLRHFEGHSIKEIAQMLEMTSEACKQAIFRGVRKMRDALQPLVGTET